jgi:hypothetical protein
LNFQQQNPLKINIFHPKPGVKRGFMTLWVEERKKERKKERGVGRVNCKCFKEG